MVSTVGRTEQIWARFTPAERAALERASQHVPGTSPATMTEYVREAAFLLAWLIGEHGSQYRQAVGAPTTLTVGLVTA